MLFRSVSQSRYAGAKFSFVPSRNLADYFREHGRRIYYRTKQREDEIKRIRSERYDLKNQIAEQGGWNKPLVYLPIEELKENTLRQYKRDGKLQARIALDIELKGLTEEATKDQKSLVIIPSYPVVLFCEADGVGKAMPRFRSKLLFVL